jgi:hypothetical protein
LSTFGEWREKLESNKKLRPKKKNSFFTFLSWRPLEVKGNSNLVPGTASATFGPDGKYAGGHAAVYMGQDQNGIQVMDQWAERPGRSAHPVAPRTIRWDGATPSNNGSLFHVIK